MGHKVVESSGQSLIEVIIATMVGILVVSALTFATIFSLRNANFAKNSAQATKLAQEGIERVRSGRDRDQCINSLGTYSWSGSNISCGNPVNPIWGYQINGDCDNPPGLCYFTVDSEGTLTNIGFARSSFPEDQAEKIPVTKTLFRRVVLLSDESGSYSTQKTVTVLVKWTDVTGSHDSKLVTILRKL